VERLDDILSRFEKATTRRNQPTGDERARLVLPDRVAADWGAIDSEKILAELAAEYRDKPLPPLSPELRAKLGAEIPEIVE
jgi:hypothetical protein